MRVGNKNILITGATGFIGSNITRRFVQLGARVSIFIRKDSLLWRIEDIKNEVTINTVDLLNCYQLKKTISAIRPDIIIHNAVYGGYTFQKDWKKIFNTNFTGTVNLLNACERFGFALFINTGSSSEYGVKKIPMKETDILEPVSAYGVAKAAVSLYCLARAKNDALPITTLRLFSPYGYYEDKTRLIPSVIISVLKNKSPRLSSPRNVRDFIFIEDVVEAYRKTVENSDKLKGEILNIGSGRQHTVSDVVEKIAEIEGKPLTPVWDAVTNSRFEPENWQANISKAKRLLNWSPKHDLREGLRKSIQWFKRNTNLYA